MRQLKLGLLLCSGLLGCSGRYVDNSHEPGGSEAGVGAGAASATGGSGSSQGGKIGSTPSFGGATSTAGSGPLAGSPPQMVDTACGVAPGQPAAIKAPITNSMMWWFRLSKLIWGDQTHAAPPDWSATISYQQAGQIADSAIDQAIAETKGIPGAESFVRRWLHLQDPAAKLVVDWSLELSRGDAIESLLNLRFQRTGVGAFTEPAFLTTQPSISRRGYVMVDALFAMQVPAEPDGIPPFVPPAGLTRREGLAQAVSQAPCAACHNFIDPLGFSLENYDADGTYVTLDAGRPIDASGRYYLPGSGAEILFNDIGDLARQLTDSCDANLGLADSFLIFALEQAGAQNTELDAGHEQDRARLRQAFMRSGRSYRSLIKAFAQSQAIRAD